jgi:hypothetical protein
MKQAHADQVRDATGGGVRLLAAPSFLEVGQHVAHSKSARGRARIFGPTRPAADWIAGGD